MEKWIKIAKQKAKQSPGKFKISALGFDHKGEYIGSAFNYLRFDRYGGGMHAEMSLIHKYGLRIKTILVCRIGRSGNLLPIHPCPRCSAKARELGIKIVPIHEYI
jgi:cytidine deaminase